MRVAMACHFFTVEEQMKVILAFIGSYLLFVAMLYYVPRHGTTVPLKPSALLALPAAAYITWRIFKQSST
jgi:hypothetical protein